MRILPLIAVLLGLAGSACAHELWIEPLNYQPAPDDRLEAQLVNGQHFGGPGKAGEPFGVLKIPFIAKYFTRFEVDLAGRAVAVEGRMGDTPALQMPPLGEGLAVAVYQSVGTLLTYDDFAKFENFARHKDAAQTLARHAERGLGRDNVTEFYTRFSKALIGVGAGAGADRAFGLEAELVALDNPYAGDVTGGMRVQVLYQGAPRAGMQVELFEKAPDGSVSVQMLRSNAEGVALLPVRAGHAYMADAVVVREGTGDAMWESLWANLTFAVPG